MYGKWMKCIFLIDTAEIQFRWKIHLTWKKMFWKYQKREAGSYRKMTDNGCKLKGGRFRLACKKELFPYEVSPVLDHVVQSPFLVFKTWQHKALSHLIWPRIWPCFELEVEVETCWDPLQPELSYDPTLLTLIFHIDCLTVIEMARNQGFGAKVSRPNDWR